MLKYNTAVCTGCRICEQACLIAHNAPCVKIQSVWPDQENVAVCRQCPNPHCVDACPSEALVREEGVIKLIKEKCSQCYQCFQACPFKAQVTNREGFPVFCDTCSGKYQCAAFCPSKALQAR